MQQFLFLSLLVCLVEVSFGAHTRSMGFSSDLREDFYELCSEDQFEYNGIKINSFHKVHGEQTLRPIGEYALEETVNYHRLFKRAEADQLEEIRSTYHRNLAEMYSSNYLNDQLYKLGDSMPQRFATLQANLNTFRGKGRNSPAADKVLSVESQKIEEAKNLSLALNAHKNDKPDLGGVLGYGQLVDLFETHLSPLRKSQKSIKMAFFKEKAADIYKKRIYKFNRFETIRRSRLFNEWRRDFGRILFDLHIPFEQNDSRHVNKTRPCVAAKELSLFFRQKGEIAH